MFVGNFTEESGGFAASDRGRDGATGVEGDASSVVVVSFPGGNPGRFGDDVGQVGEGGNVADVGEGASVDASASTGSRVARAVVLSVRKDVVRLSVDGRDNHGVVAGFRGRRAAAGVAGLVVSEGSGGKGG